MASRSTSETPTEPATPAEPETNPAAPETEAAPETVADTSTEAPRRAAITPTRPYDYDRGF